MLKYKFALCNVFWSENDINTRHFESITQQNEYFDNLTRGVFTPLSNFNMGDNIETTIVYRDDTGRDINELIRCNYLVLHKLNDNNEITERRYYFADVKQDDGNQLIVNISLDDIQTNYIRYKNQIAPCVINRRHIDRFINVDSNNVKFDLEPTSHLFENEGNNLPKRLVKRTKLDFNFTNNDEINQWLKDNIKYWVYVFIDRYHEYSVFNPSDGSEVRSAVASTTIQSNNKQDVGCICYPVYKADKRIMVYKDSAYAYINENGYGWFAERNSLNSYSFNKKISIIPPFDYFQYNATINNVGDLVATDTSYSSNYTMSGFGIRAFISDWNNKVGVFTTVNEQSTSFDSDTYTTDKIFNFSKNELKGNRNIKFEPKLLSQDFSELQVKSSDGEIFIYDNQKINNNKIKIVYTEPIQPEVTKYYARLKVPTGLYIDDTDNNYLGLVGSTDTALNMANTQYANFIANNKNFWMQSNFKMFQNVTDFAMNTMTQGLSPEGIYGFGKSMVNQIYDRKWMIDNLKASPGSLKNASGNVIFNMAITDLGIYIEEYEALIEDKIQMYDYFYMNGYSYGHIGNISDYDNTRKYFNYLECDVGVILAPLSEKEKSRLRERLRSIRFWHTDNIQYDLENYERWLD